MNYLKAIIFTCSLIILCTINNKVEAQLYLHKAVSHNDYLQQRPLLDALGVGFTTIEADLFLHSGELVVAHWFPYGKKKATLESLYLSPLAKYVQLQRDLGNDQPPQVTLLIDIKSSPVTTYLALKKLLEAYRWMLSSYQDDKILWRPVRIVLTGRKPVQLIAGEQERLVLMDDFLNSPSTSSNTKLFAMASCKYSWIIKSKDSLSHQEKVKLSGLVKAAHAQGKEARLWASPESDRIRQELLNCGIDLINTDRLKDLKRFLYSLENQPVLLAETSRRRH